MSKEKVSLSDVLLEVASKINRETHVAIPAIIDKYDFKTQKANVKINIKQMYEGVAVDIPIIPNVPVIFPASGTASLTMPVKKGDGCLVLFCDIDIKNWLLGGDNVKPQTTRKHSLSDAVAIVGLSTFTKPGGAENNDDVLLSYSGSKIRLKPNGVIDVHSAKELNIKTENVIINCTSATIKATADIDISAQNAIVNLSAAATIKAASATVETSGDITASCVNANVNASGAINTKAPTFTQTGNMKITGNIEVDGTSTLTGNTTCSATITGNAVKAGSVDLATHTHSYSQPVEGSSPTVVIPGITGTPSGGQGQLGGGGGQVQKNNAVYLPGDTL